MHKRAKIMFQETFEHSDSVTSPTPSGLTTKGIANLPLHGNPFENHGSKNSQKESMVLHVAVMATNIKNQYLN